MRKQVLGCGLSVLIGLAATFSCDAQGFDAEQLALDVQKLTVLKQILTDLKTGYQVLDAGYSAVRDIAKGSFTLHEAFLDGLLAVSPSVQSYQRAKDIINLEASMLTRYQTAWTAFQQSGHLQPGEIALLAQVYSNLFKESVQGLNDLVMVLTPGTLRASDAERIRQIDGIYTGMVENAALLDRVNNTTALMTMQRAAEQNDISVMGKLYEIK
jgi:hypothetical protein